MGVWAPALVARQEIGSHAGLAARANRIGCWALSPIPIGGIGALLNTGLKGKARAQCIEVAAPGHIAADAIMADGIIGRQRTSAPILIPGTSGEIRPRRP
jgi:hypothetical protein